MFQCGWDSSLRSEWHFCVFQQPARF